MGETAPETRRTTVIYARVSTDDQDLEHQRDNLWTYATDSLGIDPHTIDVIEDTASGASAERQGFRDLRDRIESGEVERVIAREVTRLGRDLRTIYEFVYDVVEDRGVGLHVTNDGIEIEPGEELTMMNKMYLTVLGWGAELERKKMLENQRSMMNAARAAGKWPTRPPYGFTTNEDGYLTPTDEYHNAVAAIFAVETMGWSKRQASRYSGVRRSTIRSMLSRKELYLPGETWEPDGQEVTVTGPDNPFVPDEWDETHEAALSALGDGPMPSQTLISAVERTVEEATETDATLALVQLIMAGRIGGVSGYDDLWRVEEPPEVEA